MSLFRTDPSALTPSLFATRFRESSRVLWCVAAGVLGDRDQAEDVVQEAAMLALGKLNTFRPDSSQHSSQHSSPHSSFVAWMSQYVRFVSLNHRRKQQRRQRALQDNGAVPQPAASETPLDPRSLFDRNVAAALAELSESQRTCLLLKTVVELEYREIAELLEMPAGTAMSHVSRARARMQTLLQPQVSTSSSTSKEAAQ